MKHNANTCRNSTITLIILMLCTFTRSFAQDASIFTKDGHFFDLYSMSLSPDGKILATVDKWYNCILWDVNTGQQFQTIKEIKAVAFAGSNESMCVVTEKNIVNIINLSGKVLKTISQGQINNSIRDHTKLYPEYGIYITGTSVYDINKGILLNVDIGWHINPAPAYSPVLKQLALSNRLGDSIHVYDVMSRKRLFSLETGKKDYSYVNVSYSKDGQFLTMTTGEVFKVFDMKTKQAILTFNNDPDSYVVRSAEISPDGKKVVYWTHLHVKKRERVSLIDIRSGTKLWTKEYDEIPARSVPHSLFSNDGRKLILGNHTKLYHIDTEDGTQLTSFNSYAPAFFGGLYPTKEDNMMMGLMSSDTNRIFFWNLVTGQMENVADFAPGNHFNTVKEMKPFPNGKKLVGLSGDKMVELDSSGKLLYTYPAFPKESNPRGIDVSYTGRYVLRIYFTDQCNPAQTVEVFDCVTRKKIFSRTCAVGYVSFANKQNIISILEGANCEFVRFYELPSGKLLQQVKVQPGAYCLEYSPDDLHVAVYTEGESSMRPNDDQITIIDVKKRTVASYSHPNPDKESKLAMATFSADGRYLICQDQGILYYLDLQQKAFTKNIPLIKLQGSSFSHISFSKDGRYAFTEGRHATINIFDLETKKLLARMYPDIRRKDWAVVTPDGRFDGNSGALESMYHAKDNTIVPLSAMYEKFYTPRLLPRLLAGETFDPINVDVNDLKKTPVVKMEFKESNRNLEVDDDIKTISSKSANATITVTASCPQDAVSEIRLYQNGKLIETTRNLEVDDDNTSKTLTRNFQVSLLNGNNKFSAIAFNSQRSESKPLELLVQYAPEKTAPGSNSTATQLHIVVVGINTYKNSRYNLNYAKPDAEAFKTAIESGSTGIFSKVNTHYITDTDASKAGISNAMEKVKQSAQPQDLFVFYYAGHGVVNDKKEFYLVPSDVTQLYGNDDALAQNGLSAAHLQKFSKEIKAQKQLYILDACQSAGALDNIVAARGAAEEKAIAQLARSTGTHWLTASGSTQFASEFAQLGHGSFTYCLLEAFKGKADNGDKKITVKELDAYLQMRVPEITQQYKGSAQYPASFGYGNDFPLLIVK